MVSTRRLFLGTALTGALPMVLDIPAIAQPNAAAGGRDHVLDHVGRELAAVLKGSKANASVRGEHLRLVASNLRLLQAHAGAAGAWRAADRSLAREIARRGVTGIGNDSVPSSLMAQLRNELAPYGVTVTSDDLTRTVRNTDISTRGQLFSRIQKRGFARELEDVAAAIDRLAKSADTNGPIVLARTGAQAYSEACRDLWWQIFILEATIIAMGATGAGAVAAAQLALAVLFLNHYYSLMGC